MSFPKMRRRTKRRGKMSGTFITAKGIDCKPKIDDKVVIIAKNDNKSADIWEGFIYDIDDEQIGIGGVPPNEIFFRECQAFIRDKRVSWEAEPITEDRKIKKYEVKTYEEAFPDLIKVIEEQKQEIKGLQKRMKIERDVLYGSLKAMVSPELAERFEEAIKLLLQK